MKRLFSVLFALVLTLSLVTAVSADTYRDDPPVPDTPAITEQQIRELVVAYQNEVAVWGASAIMALIEQGTAAVRDRDWLIDCLEANGVVP